MNKAKEILLVVLLVAISAVPRFVGLGKFTSIDEPFWLRVSGNYYYALTHRQFENTVYEYHPAVTTMSVIAAGMLAYFPDYRTLAPGYFRPNKFDDFMLQQHKSLLELLVYSRAVQVILIIGLLLVVYFLLRRLLGTTPAFLATGLVSTSPFFLGHSRLLNHEAMLASFLLISLLALLVYLYAEGSCWLLVLSAASGALAQLTMSSGIVLFPLGGLIILVAAFQQHKKNIGAGLLRTLRTFAIWLLLTAAAYVLFWPGMWVAPLKMLSEVYGNAFTYALQGARLSEAAGTDAGLPLSNLLRGLNIYFGGLEWRATPLSWIGFLLGVGFAFVRRKDEQTAIYGLTVLYTAILGLLFVLLFSIQRGPKPPHYTLTAYVAMDVIAGLGWWRLLDLLLQNRAQSLRLWLTSGAIAAILALQLALAVTAYPYYISYYDPIVESFKRGIQNPTLVDTGYGVGLDQAAAYLAAKPGAEHMTVMSANGLGSFSYYFPGRTIAMNSLGLKDPVILAALKESQYVVVDYYNQRRNRRLNDIKGLIPEQTIFINGIDFLRIYRSADILTRYEAANP